MRVRRPLLAFLFLFIAVPAAGAHSFELPRAKGDLIVRAAPDGEGSLMIDYIGRGARIVGPATLTGIACRDGRMVQRCVRLQKLATGYRWTVLRPIKLWHRQEGAFAIAIRGASTINRAVYLGYGSVTVRGSGSYRADGAESVSYAPEDLTVSVNLKP